jgi:hypothetical protein
LRSKGVASNRGCDKSGLCLNPDGACWIRSLGGCLERLQTAIHPQFDKTAILDGGLAHKAAVGSRFENATFAKHQDKIG